MIRLLSELERLLPEISDIFGEPVLIEGGARYCSAEMEKLAGGGDFSCVFSPCEGRGGLCRPGTAELAVGRGEIARRVLLPGVRILLEDGNGGALSAVSAGSSAVLCALFACALVRLLEAEREDLAAAAKKTLDLLPCAVGWKDGGFKYLGVNKKMREVFPGAGNGEDDYGKPWKNVAFLNRRQDIRVLAGALPQEFLLPLAAGAERGFAKLIKHAVRDGEGRLAAIVTCLEMNKGEKIDAAALEAVQTADIEKSIADSSGVIAFRFCRETDGRTVYVSDGIRSMGYDPGPFADGRTSFFQIFHPQDRSMVAELFNSPDCGDHVDFSARIRLTDGAARHVHGRFREIDGPDGPCWEGTLFDVTAQEDARRALIESAKSAQERCDLILEMDMAPVNPEGLLSTYIDADRLQSRQNTLAEVTNLSAVLIDTLGEYVTQLSGEVCPACLLVRRRGADMTYCRRRYMEQMYQSSVSGGTVIEACPATGLLTAAVPLMIERSHAAAWIIGQIRPGPVPEEEIRKTCKGMGRAPEAIIKALEKMPAEDPSAFKKAVAEWERLADAVGLECGRLSRIMLQDEAARQMHKRMFRGYEQQRLINRCFTLTYESADLTEAMNRIFGEIGGELGFSRVYLIERKASGLYALSVEWAAHGIAPVPWEHRVFSPAALWRYAYDSHEITVFDRESMSASSMGEYFLDTGALSSVQFPIFESGELVGILGMDECVRMRVYFGPERTLMQTLLHMISNIVLRRKAERETSLTQTVMNSVMKNIDLIVYATDIVTGRVVYANDRFLRLTGADPGAAADPYFPVVKGEDGRPVFSEIWKDGRCYMTARNVVPWMDGQIVQIVSAADITRNKENESKVQNLAYRDGLLGIGNRRKFEEDLARAMKAAAEDGAKGALVFIDLDDFKYINDTYGHESGDRLLMSIARALAGTGGEGCELYRLGGDEFMIMTLERRDVEDSEGLVERLWSRFQQPWSIGDGKEAPCTASLGVARFPEHGKTAVEVLRHADIAMYKAKYEGKNSVAFYRDGLDGGLSRRITLENRLRESVQGGCRDFVLLYQPILHGKTGRVVGAEALIRWRGEDGRLLRPDAFVELAESLGLLGEIGRWVFGTALRDLAGYAPVNIHINLAVRQLQSKTLVSDCEKALRGSGVSPDRLFIEVSEQIFMQDVTQSRLEELRNAGVRVVIDRFGSERSVIPSLIHLPADCLSVDPSYVLNMESDDFARAFVKSAVELAHAAGFMARAVGVESASQKRALADYDFIQGRLCGEPMEIEDFDAWLMRYVTRKTHLRSGGGRRTE